MSRGTVGCEVLRLSRQGIAGTVEGIFSKAAHLHAGRTVITVGSTDLPSHPFTITVVSPPAHLQRGEPFLLKEGRLVLKGGRIIDLRGVERFTPCRSVNAPASVDRLAECLQAARREALSGFPDDGLGALLGAGGENIYTAAARPYAAALQQAISGGNWESMRKPVQKLAGLGPGLTPSGDDLLSGVLAALAFHRASGGSGPPHQFLFELAESAGALTSTFSAQMMRCASRGLVSEDMAGWLAAVHRGEVETVPACTRRVIDYGHTSGIDCLCGLILALESLTGG